MINTNRLHFKMMSFMHETLYGLFRDPYKALNTAGVEAGHKVLEVGCGPGFFTIPAAKVVGKKGRVLALDVNPFAVKHVQQKIEAEGITNAKVMLADAARTRLTEKGFDLVFVFGFAHASGDMEEIWRELHRLTRPGGTMSVEGRPKPPTSLFELVKRQGSISRYRKIG